MSYRKMPVVLAILLVGFLLVSPLYAGTIFQNFTNNSFNAKYFWLNTPASPNLPSVEVANNRLELTVPANTSQMGAAGLQNWSNYNLTGDYDIQVDFNLIDWPTDNGVHPGIVTLNYEVARVNFDFGHGPQEAYLVSFIGEGFHSTATSDNSGKLRLSRAGNTVSGYYWSNNAWQLIASRTDATYGAPISFYVGGYSGSRTISLDTKVAFGNLLVTNTVFPASLAPLYNQLMQN